MKIYILLWCVLCVSCSYKKADKIAPFINIVSPGENFCINLPENHTDGYLWQINPKFNTNVLDYYGSVFRGNEKGVEFNFKSLSKGIDTLNFALIKYRDTLETKQYIIEIK
ncbi:MAG: Chagasin family peptidase inhibitor [Bacteroidota bacterium]|jgi:predicted secreted protein|nr:Chagasin family peptidase inhibitor [Bacteroidota bacterium]